VAFDGKRDEAPSKPPFHAVQLLLGAEDQDFQVAIRARPVGIDCELHMTFSRTRLSSFFDVLRSRLTQVPSKWFIDWQLAIRASEWSGWISPKLTCQEFLTLVRGVLARPPKPAPPRPGTPRPPDLVDNRTGTREAAVDYAVYLDQYFQGFIGFLVTRKKRRILPIPTPPGA
jgi:hypothetical protein